MLEQPKFGSLTQGTIFCCAKAEDYSGCDVAGLVITARCDVANDKTPIYTYLPIVSLRDWLDRDGGTLIASRAANEAIASLRQELKGAGHSISILETEPWLNIVETLFPDSGKKAAKAVRERALKAIERHEAATKCLATPFGAKRAHDVVRENHGIVRSLISELTTHRLAGYYFMQKIDPAGKAAGFVIQLREVNSLPRPLASSVAGGLDLSLSTDQMIHATRYLDRGTTNYAMPLAQVTSPTIEHILQQFSLTFSRIGVADVPIDYVSDFLLGSILSVEGKN